MTLIIVLKGPSKSHDASRGKQFIMQGSFPDTYCQDKSGNSGSEDTDRGVATATAPPKLARPPKYKVLLNNDDYTPMEFVVDVLVKFFYMPVEKATQIMLKVHTDGKAVCGVYSRDIAETKADQVNSYSRENQQPLLCHIEVDQ